MDRPSRWDNTRYDSLPAFYQDVYSAALTDLRPAGRTGAFVGGVSQNAGDWSDAPTPDLTVALLTSSAVPVTIDLGAGRYCGVQPRNGFIVVPPGSGSHIVREGRHRVIGISIPYAGLSMLAGKDGGLPSDGDFGVVHAGVNEDDDVTRLIGQLWRETKALSPHGALYADGVMLQLVAALLALRDRTRIASARGGLAAWQLRRVTQYMDDNLDQDVGLAELAALIGLSPGHFCTAFRQSAGLPPASWLLARRIDRARELMVGAPKLGLTEIALTVGYASHSAFSAAFRRVTAVSPSTWRRERSPGSLDPD